MSDKVEKLTEYYGGDNLAASVLADKYLLESETKPEEMWFRIADAAANIEPDGNEKQNKKDEYRKKFYNILDDFKFIPGGRIMYALGREEKVSNTNCYVIPHKEDSIEGIYDWMKESALTYRSTGGVGTDISILRPKGTPVKNSGGVSPGACSFMDLMSNSTNTVHQKLRRGALMITINVHHPDVLDFINIKKILGEIQYLEGEGDGYNNLYKMVEHANISVQITDEFLEALENGKNYEQRWPVDGTPSVRKKVSAKKIWDAIIKNAHEHAEPGIFFIDNHRKNDALAYVNPAITTNPCGEQFLGAYANCLLGHMNLAKYIDSDEYDKGSFFSYNHFADDIKTAVRFLDNCIDWNKGKHALPQQEETATNERHIGLGITGLGDCLIRLGIKYDSDEALELVEKIMKVYRDSAYAASVDLAKEKGPFPWFQQKEWMESEFVKNWLVDATASTDNPDILKDGIRNSFLLTVAPVGSGSIIGQVSSGIEPIFATSYTRRVRQQDGKKFTEFKTYPKIINELFGDDTKLPDYVVTAHDVDPYFRVKLQAVIQKYVDNSISSTVNLPNETKPEVIDDIYVNAWKMGLKSITVYREGSREGVLITESKKSPIPEPKQRPKRPIVIQGKTFKIPSGPDEKLYITINPFPDNPEMPYEIFISSYGADNPEIQTITVLLSALMKNVDDISFVIEHLKKIESSAAPVWWHDVDAGRRHTITSRAQAVAIALEKFVKNGEYNKSQPLNEEDLGKLEKCPKCGQFGWKNENGCGSCIECGYSKCN
ncbi:adenosylcobalamin-dependent ribonucleoside-diphosphate reductase [candidate division WWE3 bacterium]|nr:adenosylcobalamin-dependent ribonucleoside-diphosphate reductase [candidate division WWE3 bacterium]